MAAVKCQKQLLLSFLLNREVITRGKLYTLGNTSLNVRSVPR